MRDLLKIISSFFGTLMTELLVVYLLAGPAAISDTSMAMQLVLAAFLTVQLYGKDILI